MTKETITDVVNESENVDTQEEVTTQKTFTKEEVDKLIKNNVNRAVAKAHKDAQAKADEAEKLKQMNYEQKAKYEQDKANNRIKELEAELTRKGLEQEATAILQKKGIKVTSDVLSFCVKDDAEKTQQAVNTFVETIDELVNTRVTETLKGRTPKRVTNENVLSKEEFDNLSYSQKAELFTQNPILYNELKGR